MENKNIDLAIDALKSNIIDTINDAQMPPSIIYYVVKDIYEKLASSYRLYLQQEKEKAVAVKKEQT